LSSSLSDDNKENSNTNYSLSGKINKEVDKNKTNYSLSAQISNQSKPDKNNQQRNNFLFA
jgi:hypothetical protein